MSRGLTVLSFGLGAWALLSVIRAMRLADEIAVSGGAWANSMALEVAIWVVPVLIGGLMAVLLVSRPSAGVDVHLARNVRMGVMVAAFAVLLAWMLVLFAGYVGAMSGRSPVAGHRSPAREWRSGACRGGTTSCGGGLIPSRS